MSNGNRNVYKGYFLRAAMAAVVIGAAVMVDFSPASPRQNFPATKPALTGVSGALNRPAGVTAPSASQLVANYGKLPLSFEANEGQTDGHVKFLSRGRGYSLFLTGDEAVLTLTKSSVVSHQSSAGERQKPGVRSQEPGANRGQQTPDNGPLTTDSVLRMKLVDANARAAVAGAQELPGKSNYFIGNDPKKWRTNVPTYAQVKYRGVYPGVDLVYYGNQSGQLEYDFVVAPGADPAAIGLALSGGLEVGSRHGAVGSGSQIKTAPQSKSQNLKSQIDPNGDLVIQTSGGDLRFHKPVVYQSAIHPGLRTPDSGPRTPDCRRGPLCPHCGE